jgi:penicillin-insensitive murein endopeptidase
MKRNPSLIILALTTLSLTLASCGRPGASIQDDDLKDTNRDEMSGQRLNRYRSRKQKIYQPLPGATPSDAPSESVSPSPVPSKKTSVQVVVPVPTPTRTSDLGVEVISEPARPTATPTATQIPTPTPTPTQIPFPTVTLTPAPIPSPRPSAPTPIATPIATPTPTPTPTPTTVSDFTYSFDTESFPQAIGFYAEGKLQDAIQLPNSGFGFARYLTKKDRSWGTTDMITLIQNVSEVFFKNFPEFGPLAVGDISQREGGDITPHAAHQNGLDADILYVKKQRTKSYDAQGNLDLFKLIVASKHINRIFLSPAMKKKVCAHAKTNELMSDELTQETLRRLRPISKHTTHFHIRMVCPVGSQAVCDDQEEPPAGTGC